MPSWLSWLLPDQASTLAPETDALFLFLVALTGFVALLVFILITRFAIRYRRRPGNEKGADIPGFMSMEIAWSLVPLLIFMGIFLWGAVLYYQRSTPPPDAINVYVVAKQWMWKMQHLEGPREINELHVPLGAPVRLVMTSQDVIHSFFVPAFRIKQDVLPGRYTTHWFQATKPGRYHLFCAEYCGNLHSRMRGWIEVMPPPDFQKWLDSERRTQPMTAVGESLFAKLGCAGCHTDTDTSRGPSLHNIYARPRPLQGGKSVIADESYLRESVLNPAAKTVEGYPPIMPTYQGQIGDEELNELIEYMKSLGK